MTALTEFRDHARAMAQPPPDTKGTAWWCRNGNHRACDGRDPYRGPCGCTCHPLNTPRTDAERALWTRLADEADAYLERNTDQPIDLDTNTPGGTA